MNKEIDFLKELQKELKTQNHDSQASPRFWTVADYEDRVVGDGYHDKVEIYSPDSCTSQSLVEAIEELKEYNGKDGQRSYVAVDGIVYDVTDVPEWQNGMHNGQEAGKDVTEAIKNISPHGTSMLSKAEKVGYLK